MTLSVAQVELFPAFENAIVGEGMASLLAAIDFEQSNTNNDAFADIAIVSND